MGSWQATLGRQHGRTQRKGRGRLTAARGRGIQAEAVAGAKVLKCTCACMGPSPGRAAPRPPTVHPPVCGSPPWPPLHPGAFPASHAWPKTEPMLARPPRRKVEALSEGLGRGRQRAPPAHPAPPSHPLLLSPASSPQTPWNLPHPGSHLHERQRVLGHIHRAWCDPLDGTDDWGPPVA